MKKQSMKTKMKLAMAKSNLFIEIAEDFMDMMVKAKRLKRMSKPRCKSK